MITNNNKNIEEWSMLIEPLLPMLMAECKTDSDFAFAFCRADRSMEECCEYIYKEVKDRTNGKKAACIPDAEVIDLAKEYFEEGINYDQTINEEEDENDD